MLLVIDDDPTVAPLVAAMLRIGGEGALHVRSAGSLRSGLDAIAEVRPVVVLLDLRLPDSDGLETIRQLRRTVGDQVPVVAVTADGDRELAISSLREGADDFLLKTELTAATVARTIRYAIERAQFQRSRRQAEEALRASNERLEIAIEAGRLGVWDWDFESARLRCAGGEARLFGCDTESHVTTIDAALQRVHPGDRAALQLAMRDAPEIQGARRLEFRVVAPDGATRFIEGHGRVIRDAAGRATGMAGVIVDVTERRVASEKQIQSQRLEAVGELAAGIAHDLGNVLALGMTALDQLDTKNGHSEASAARDDLHLAISQARELVNSLLAFAVPDRSGTPKPAATELGAATEGFVRFLRRVLPARLRLTVDRGDVAAWVRLDRGPLQQMLMNLVLNARDALDGEGHVEVRVRAGEGASAPHVLEVLDDGPGIAADALPRLFDAFYSRRADGSGVGLGLAIVKSIVDAAGGSIRVASRREGGTSVQVLLPAVAAPEAALRSGAGSSPARTSLAAGSAAPMVAIVEPHDYVRRVMADGLIEAGFRVSEWVSASSLVRAVEGGAPSPDVLIIDQLVAEDGDRAVDQLRAAGCVAPVLRIAGENEPTIRSGGMLRKPFSIADLRRSIEAALSGGTVP